MCNFLGKLGKKPSLESHHCMSISNHQSTETLAA